VIVRTQGRRLPALEENLLSLAAQTCGDFEVLLVGHDVDAPHAAAVGSVVEAFADDFVGRIRRLEVSGGGRSRPLNVALGEAHGRYAAFLDDDDVAFSDWVGMFRQVALLHPGAVIWTQVAGQPVDSVTCAGREVMRASEPPEAFTETFNILPHLCQNQTPNCGLAIPVSCFREQGARYREDLPVLEDWDMVLQVAQLRPIEVTGRVTALYRRGDSDNSSTVHTHDDWDEAEAAVLGALESSSFVLRGEFLPEIRETMDDLESLRFEEDAAGEQIESLSEQVADLERRLAAALSASSAGAISGVATGPVGAAARPSSGTERGSDLIDALKQRTVVVISTHMDDGVLSCGDLIWQVPRCVVLTVFAGDDVDWSRPHEWDEGCGFSAGTNVTAVRVVEDERALALLGSTGLRLAFLDEQYRRPGIAPSIEEVSEAILAAINKIGAETILFPLGLGHDDHRLTAGGAAHAARRAPHLNWFAYEDLPYGYEDEGEVEEALAALADMTPTPVELGKESDLERKDAALELYRSQLIALQDRWVLALQPERYWALTAGRT
jgi:LmbE family N-acetylglucosaminyl deacetylase